MNKFLKIIILPLLSLTLTSCGSVSYEKYENEDKYEIGNQTYECSDINNLNINWASGSVRLEKGEGNKIEVYERGHETLMKDQKVRSYLDGDTLTIHFWKSGYRSVLYNSKLKDLTLTLPNDVFEKFNLKMTSGAFIYDGDITADDINIKMTSGDFKAKSLSSNKLDLDLTSGKFVISDRLNVGEAKLKMTSGKIDFLGERFSYFKNLDVEMTSGKFKSYIGVAEKVKLKMTSGSMTTRIHESAVFYVKYTSGSIRCETEADKPAEGVYIIGTGGPIYNVEMTSGSLTIKE